MDTSADLREGLGSLPGFRVPTHRQMDPLLTAEGSQATAQADPEGEPHRPSPPSLPGRPTPKQGTDATPTATSSASKPEPNAKDAAKLVAGLLGLAVVGIAAVVRLRRGRQLRQPSKLQLDDISQPLARIAMRHVPAELLGKDLADLALAGAAVGAYLNDGPLIEAVDVDPGLPGDLGNYAPDQEPT